MASKASEGVSTHELHDRNGSQLDNDQKDFGTKGGTAQDAIDMYRMGRPQELRVRNTPLSKLDIEHQCIDHLHSATSSS